MNGRPLTDARISEALRAHLPARAEAGLRDRIIEAVETTGQQRAFPSFLGALSEADPVSRRRSLLMAAAILIALAIASATAVGALRLLQRDPVDYLSLDPPADLPAFVLSSYERLPHLPPVALTWREGDTEKGRIYVSQSGAVRFDRFTSPEATEPSSFTILSGKRISGMAPVESEAVWVEPGHDAIEDDPRVFIRSILDGDGAGPGCELTPDPDGVGAGIEATGWRHIGVEYVAGRPTHHVACLGALSLDIDLWFDIESRLILRTREPQTDDAGAPIPGQFRTVEVTEIAFGDQPAALFEPPEGVTRMSPEAYAAYLCTHDRPDEERVGLSGIREDCSIEPEAEATPSPTPTGMPTIRPSLSPSPGRPAGPLAWTEASLQEDWPAPVRLEPDGGAIVQPILLNIVPLDAESCCKVYELGRYLDPPDDTGPAVTPRVDITMVSFCGRTCLQVWVPDPPPDVDPTELWIAYGLVVDDDGDGTADRRLGIDNAPRTRAGEREHRTWITDLHTGRTESAIGDAYGLGNFTLDRSLYPVEGDNWPTGQPCSAGSALFGFVGGDVAGGGSFGSVPALFFAWAAVIENGQVVATDYAPDTGWLQPSSKAPPSAPETGEVWACPPEVGATGE
jgi:hypothetical protein